MQKSMQSAIEGSGELLSNREKNIQVETIEKEFEGLNVRVLNALEIFANL